jgi:arylsulfatase A-like enzyme
MKTVFIMLDSLNRHYLNAYGDSWVRTPTIDRLAARGLVFDKHFCCSMPCMPARRDLYTGHVNFLETPWSPLQPWDDCLQPELRRQKGVYSHMITDHYHYFHSGGECYHTRFDSWDFERGQEGDVWRAVVDLPEPPPFKGKNRRAYWANRACMDPERDEDYPTPRCFMRGIEFLERNADADDWHLHLECFDPHEPFACPQRYRDMYGDEWRGDYHFDWPDYAPVSEDEAAVEHIRKSYAGTLSMADAWLGRFLDTMDRLDLWQDTTVVLTTDHGHLLGEQGYWAKNYMFDYKELVHIPLIVCTPQTATKPGRVGALTSTIDMMPTFMELHGGELPPHVHGRSLGHLLEGDTQHHDAVLYGYFGKDVNLTDGRYTYCRQPLPDSHLYHHTAMPCSFADFHGRGQLAQAETGVFLQHAYDIPHYRLKVPSKRHHNAPDFNPIYNIGADPLQKSPVRDEELERQLAGRMRQLLQEYDAPECQYQRLGF